MSPNLDTRDMVLQHGDELGYDQWKYARIYDENRTYNARRNHDFWLDL